MTAAAKFAFRYRARVLSVHDGDTVTLEVDLGGDIRATWPVRLLNVYAPELKQRGGTATRQFTEGWLQDVPRVSWPLLVETFKTSGDITRKSFERYLAIVREATRPEVGTLNEDVQRFVTEHGYDGGQGAKP